MSKRAAAQNLDLCVGGTRLVDVPAAPASGVRKVSEGLGRDLATVVDVGCQGFIADPRPGDTVERRQRNCAYIVAAEDAWIASHRAGNARCPEGCRGYVERVFQISVGPTMAGAKLASR